MYCPCVKEVLDTRELQPLLPQEMLKLHQLPMGYQRRLHLPCPLVPLHD